MKNYLLFVLLPVIIISIIRSAKRRERAVQRAETPPSGTTPDPVLRKEPRPDPKFPLKKNLAVHTEGKHPAEIKIQQEMIQASDHTSARLEETRRELKETDLKHLRTAVVMSEILDRPVSLRRRGYPR